MVGLVQYAQLTAPQQRDPALLDAFACALSEESLKEALS